MLRGIVAIMLGGIVAMLFGIVFIAVGAHALSYTITFTIDLFGYHQTSVITQEGAQISLVIGIAMLLGGLVMTYVARSEWARLLPARGELAATWADLKYTLYLLRKNPLVVTGSVIAIFFVALSLLANVIVDPNLANPTGYPEFKGQYPFERKFMWDKNSIIKWGPGIRLYEGPEQFYLGTDNWGRDLLKMIILAIPVDMKEAFIITLAAAAFGTLIGALAGYVGGVADEAALRITDIFLAFPSLVLALVFAAMFGRTLPTLRLALLLVWWPPYVRLIRGQILSEKEKGYVEALRALGAGHLRTLFRHIIPNAIYPILVQATLDFGGVILTFSALMFLGFSPSPSLPELGNLASSGYEHIFEAPWLIVFPGLTMLIIALAFNLVGDGLRDVLDPKLRR